jgi:acetyltransferase-like isoleucine patch superfamily enzyme/acyl carrier protein
VIAPRGAAADPVRLAALIARAGVTVIQATPATWRLLVESGWPGDRRLKILTGGEALPTDLAAQLLPRCASLWNMYGPTETTIWSSIARIHRADDVSLGRPIANTELYVLDARQQPAPIGVPGELHIGGEGLALGYWKRPDLSEKAFIAHPFDTTPGARLYRTGDLVRYRADGRVEFIGRVDHQVKILGYRIELGEIEAVIRQHPDVVDAVVLVFSARDLRQYLSERLPDYMVPSAVVRLNAIPLTSSGKIDRTALQKPTSNDHATATPRRPGTPTEQAMARIWSELLGLENVGVDDNLFNLGGHSLMVVRMLLLIQQRFSVKLPVKTILANPTITALSSVVDAHTAGVQEPTLPASDAESTEPKADEDDQPHKRRSPRSLKARLGFERETLGQGFLNRVLQLAARAAPTPWRTRLHRWRGVRIGHNVLIGYDSILETSYPWLVSIGNNAAIGMRVTIIGHFLGMEGRAVEQRQVSVDIGENVWIGPGSLILPNVKIGDGAVVVAGSVVSGSVPAGVVVQGNPARPVALCPSPLRAGVSYEAFLSQLQPLEGEHASRDSGN